MDITEFADIIASECISHYKNLGKRGKPVVNQEWTVLSCFVLTTLKDSVNSSDLSVVAAATGTKCLGHSQMKPGGNLVNDSHAEVLARRCLIRYIYDQISIYKNTGSSDLIIGLDENKRYKINPKVQFNFFSTHVPCGDASIIPKDPSEGIKRKHSLEANEHNQPSKKMKILNESSDACDEMQSFGLRTMKNMVEDCVGEEVESDIHRTGAKCIGESDGKLPGSLYHKVGVVRTKPGRGDPTLCVSCSDKLAKWLRCGVQFFFQTTWRRKMMFHSLFMKSPEDSSVFF